MRDQTVVMQVAAAVDVACPRSRYSHAARREVNAPVCTGGKLLAALAGRIRLVSAKARILQKRLARFIVLINLIAGDNHSRAHRIGRAHALKHIDRAHRVRQKRLAGMLCSLPNDGLGGQMEHNFRVKGAVRCMKRLPVRHIAVHALVKL